MKILFAVGVILGVILFVPLSGVLWMILGGIVVTVLS